MTRRRVVEDLMASTGWRNDGTAAPQSVRDALADAETLIRITQSAHGVESIATYYDGPAVFAAAKYGADLAWHMRSGALPSRRMILRPFRAAFRAVPALRGV